MSKVKLFTTVVAILGLGLLSGCGGEEKPKGPDFRLLTKNLRARLTEVSTRARKADVGTDVGKIQQQNVIQKELMVARTEMAANLASYGGINLNMAGIKKINSKLDDVEKLLDTLEGK